MWQETESPHVCNWIDEVEETYRLEELKVSHLEMIGDHRKKWEKWRDYKRTWSYAERVRLS